MSNGLGSQYTVLVSLFARNLLHGGPSLYGFLLAAMGVGAAGGAVTIATADSTRAMVRNLAIGLFVSSIAIAAFGLSPWIVLSIAAQILTGYGFTSSRATTNTLLQLFVADELRGRVMSFYTLSALGMAPFGAIQVGFVGEHARPASRRRVMRRYLTGMRDRAPHPRLNDLPPPPASEEKTVVASNPDGAANPTTTVITLGRRLITLSGQCTCGGFSNLRTASAITPANSPNAQRSSRIVAKPRIR